MGKNVIVAGRQNDLENFAVLVEKLDQAGIDKSKVFDVLSGLLHLGEVTFSTEDGTNN